MSAVHIQRDADLAVVVIDNPPLNLFDEKVFAQWEKVAEQLVALTDPARDDRARAVLVEARSKVVSAGVDVAMFRTIAGRPDAVKIAGDWWERLVHIVQTVEELPVPTSSPRTPSPSRRPSNSRWAATFSSRPRVRRSDSSRPWSE